jgi:hypothetical protein
MTKHEVFYTRKRTTRLRRLGILCQTRDHMFIVELYHVLTHY